MKRFILFYTSFFLLFAGYLFSVWQIEDSQLERETIVAYVEEIITKGLAKAPMRGAEQIMTKKTMIERIRPDCIVVGTSRAMRINPDKLNFFEHCNLAFNASVYGGNYLTHQMMINKFSQVPGKKMIILWSPIEALYDGDEWIGSEKVKHFKSEMDLNSFFSEEYFRFLGHFIKYSFRVTSISQIFLKETKQKISTYSKERIEKNGRIEYPREVFEAPRHHHRKWLLKAAYARVLKRQLDVSLDRWCSILSKMNEQGVKIKLVDLKVNHSKIQSYTDAKNEELAQKCGYSVEVIDPKSICKKSDFIDEAHLTGQCIDRIFQEI